MTTAKNEKVTPTASNDLEAKRLEGLREMTPKELAEFMQRQEQIELQRENNAILRATRRMTENIDAPVAERLRVVGEQRDALALEQPSGTVAGSYALELPLVQGAPTVHVPLTIKVQRRAGQVWPTSVTPDFAKVDPIWVEDSKRPLLPQFDEAERAGDTNALAALSKVIHGRSAIGLQHRRWSEGWSVILQKLVGTKPLEDIGGLTVTGEITWDTPRLPDNGKLP